MQTNHQQHTTKTSTSASEEINVEAAAAVILIEMIANNTSNEATFDS